MPLQIIRQDITKMQVDAIVNTTNQEMVGYSGVDLAVHRAAGAKFDEECRALAPLGLGQAKLSGAYDLPCKYVIHTSGPFWQGGLAGALYGYDNIPKEWRDTLIKRDCIEDLCEKACESWLK